MNRHRYGLAHGLPLDIFQFLSGYKQPGISPRQKSTKALIVANELLLRVESRAMVDLFFFQNITAICPHLNNSLMTPLSSRTFCRLRHFDRGEQPCSDCLGLKKCKWCETEYEIELEQSQWGTTLVITAWKNLGPCSSPSDPKLRSQAVFPGTPWLDEDVPPRATRGSLRSAFSAVEKTPWYIRFDMDKSEVCQFYDGYRLIEP